MLNIITSHKKKTRFILLCLITIFIVLAGVSIMTILETEMKIDNIKNIITAKNKNLLEYMSFIDAHIEIKNSTSHIDMYTDRTKDKARMIKIDESTHIISDSTFENIHGTAFSDGKVYKFQSSAVNIDASIIKLFDNFRIEKIKPDEARISGKEIILDTNTNEVFAEQKTTIISNGYTIYPNRFHYKQNIIDITSGFTGFSKEYEFSGHDATIITTQENKVQKATIIGNGFVFDRLKSTTITGDEIIFDDTSSIIQIYGNAELTSPQYHTIGDYLEYNRHSGVGIFENKSDSQVEIDLMDK